MFYVFWGALSDKVKNTKKSEASSSLFNFPQCCSNRKDDLVCITLLNFVIGRKELCNFTTEVGDG